MKVLQVNKFYHPVVGGIEQVVRQLSKGLPDQEVDAEVLTARKRGRGATETVEGVPVVRTASLGVVLSTPIAPTFPLRLRQLSSDSDVIHYHLPNPLAVMSHYLSQPSSQVVVTYHSDIIRQTNALKVYQPLLDWFLNDADRIISTSPRLRDHSSHLGPHREKTEVIPLSVNLDRIKALGKGEWREENNESVPMILFAGRLNYYKGLSYLLEAIPLVETEAKLVIVGEGERRRDLERQVRSLGIGDKVQFLGHVNDETLHDYYAQSSLFVLPSVEPSEAFGIVQLEAMAHGLPVINTNLPTGVPWVSIDGETGITVPPRDSTALATAIDELLSDTERRSSYGRAARERVEARFTEERMIADTIELYRSLRT